MLFQRFGNNSITHSGIEEMAGKNELIREDNYIGQSEEIIQITKAKQYKELHEVIFENG